ncbi:uncharacterized protein LOC110428478 isoform X1 [Herrania umbratica]|uniref:Uncharacterized protein LOC110428478 isoform X1 n=1 Tax=Herrania umbratica TaxID=108875 RepID=A0A6J1BLM1_9ROSI|nr:uncharacterized protein LOC110428478 isoform X1 [Herrania umbratica]
MKQGAKLTSQMNNRRELNPDQRRAKNEGDRRRRREHTVEFQRLQMAEAELQALLETQRSENRNLREKNERLNAMLSNLMNMIHQLREERRQQRETMEMSRLFVCRLTHGFNLIEFQVPMKMVQVMRLLLEGIKKRSYQLAFNSLQCA